MKKLIALVLCGFMVLAATAAFATTVAVVDSEKILVESAPGKAGVAHLKKVEQVLQKGYDDLLALYKGKENTAEGAQAIAQAQAVLQQQLMVEQGAVRQAISEKLVAVVKAWRKKNAKIELVVGRHLLLDYAAALDITPDIMKEMNVVTVKFPDLPKVTVNPPKK